MKIPQNIQQSPSAGRLHPIRRNHARGMTLLELTVVILVLLTLISVLFIGAQAWKRGSDRAICIMNIRNVQLGIRAYSNLYGYDENASVPGLQNEVIGMGRFVETTPECPAAGTYEFGAINGPNVIPPSGTIYLSCSLAGSNEHVPENTPDW